MSVINSRLLLSQDLARLIDHITLISNNSENEYSPIQKYLPTGLFEIIIHLPPVNVIGWNGRLWCRHPDNYIDCALSEPVVWKIPPKGFVIQIGLKPEKVERFCQIPLAILHNTFLDFQHVMDTDFFSVVKPFLGSTNVPTRMEVFTANLLLHISPIHQFNDEITEAIEKIRRSHGRMSIHDISEKIGISERQLERKFKSRLGIRPKTYQRIIRFSDTWHYLLNTRESDWINLSFIFGYADQSHLIREFKSFSGITPSSFLQQSLQ